MSETYETKIREKKRKAILESLSAGSSISQACRAARVGRATMWRWRKRNKEFNEKVEAILNSRTQTVEDALYKAAVEGNVTAQIFWLKNRAPDRWRNVTHQKVSVGAKVEFEVIDSNGEPATKAET